MTSNVSDNMPERPPDKNAQTSLARRRALGIAAIVCFCLACLALVAYLATAVAAYFGRAGGEMGAAGPVLTELGLIHALGLLGVVFAFIGRGSRLARWGLWMNAILLVVFWVGMAMTPF